MSSTAPNLNDYHRNALLAGLKYIDRLLGDGLSAVAPAEAGADAVFAPVVPDATPIQRKVIAAQVARIRRTIRAALESCEIPIGAPEISAMRSMRSSLTAAAVSLEELGPEYLRGYGALDDATASRMAAIQAEIRASLDALGRYAAVGVGADLAAALARLDQTTDEARLLRELERIVTAHDFVEFRPALSHLIGRLEKSWWTVAFVGRVSCGKSSLLNHLLATDVLPTGVTPVTAVPIRIVGGGAASATISFATGRPERIDAAAIGEFASEESNPGNCRHVAEILLELPSRRLEGDVCFVDTPGLGSLATAGAAQTLAFLPRCDAGVLLIDASAAPCEEDIEVASSLAQGGAEVLVVVSKADLLVAPDREKMRAYVASQFSGALGSEVPVSLVSVAAGHAALAQDWWDEALGPRRSRHRELAAATLRRKIGALRDAVAAALSRRGGGCAAIQSASQVHAQLGAARAAIEEARRRASNLPFSAAPRPGSALDAAAAPLAVLETGDELRAALARELGRSAALYAECFESLLRDAREEAGRALPGFAFPQPGSRPLFDPAPVVDAGCVRAGWRRWPTAATRRAALRRHLRARFSRALDDALRHYGHALVGWSRRYLDDLASHFDAQAGLKEAAGACAAAPAGPMPPETARDIELLRNWGSQPAR
jgi:GTP-binding protein EngB required for normal cell division